MVDAITVLAVALLVGGVLGTLIPLVPGSLLSMTGVLLYWWGSEFTQPGTIAVVFLLSLGVLTLVVELFGSALAARAGGAAWRTAALAVVAGLVLMAVSGPVGLLLGIFGTVFVVEYAENGDVERSARSAGYATVGILASTVVQVMLTASILLGFVVAVFVF